MGFTPSQVNEMSLWEYLACFEGYKAAHGGDDRSGGGEGMSEDRMRDLGIL